MNRTEQEYSTKADASASNLDLNSLIALVVSQLLSRGAAALQRRLAAWLGIATPDEQTPPSQPPMRPFPGDEVSELLRLRRLVDDGDIPD